MTPRNITGPARTDLAAQCARSYAGGATVRDLATANGTSYGFMHRLLVEAGVTLRARGGSRGAK